LNVECVSMEESTEEESLKKLVRKFCKSEEFDENLLKKIKKICRRNDQHVLAAFESSFECLSKNHSVVRFNSLKLIDQLFNRSHFFRTLVIKKLEFLSNSVLGINPEKPLPLPASQQRKLVREGILAIKGWVQKYGEGYKQLRIAYDCLKEVVDFQEVGLYSDPERKRNRERQERLATIAQQRLEKIRNEKTELDPVLDDFFARTTSLLNILAEGSSSALQEELKGNIRLIEKSYLPKLKGWIDSLTRHSTSGSQTTLRSSMNIKARLDKLLEELKTHYKADINEAESSNIIEKTPSKREADKSSDPTTFEATLKKLKVDPGSLDTINETPVASGSKDSNIPVLKLSDLTVPDRMIVDPERSRFWVSDHREGQVLEVGTTSRVSEFVGEYQPVTKSCRAPLGNGNLCPRMDRTKCPLHGPIIPRNSEGQAIEAKVVEMAVPLVNSKKSKQKSGLKSAAKYDETSRSRISKKISSKSSLKRLATDLNRYDKIRTKDKFSDQFNY